MGVTVLGLEIAASFAAAAAFKGSNPSFGSRSSKFSGASSSKDFRKAFFGSGDGSSRLRETIPLRESCIVLNFSAPRATLAVEKATGIQRGTGDGGNALELGFQPRSSDNETAGAVLQVENLTLSAGGRDLINGGEWRLMPGQHTGIVGVNGCGKSTLLRAIVGAQEFQSGTITMAQGTEVAYLEQTAVSGSTRTVWEEVGSRMIAVKSALHELELAEKAVEMAGEKELEAAIERLGKAQERVEALDGYRIDETISGVLNGLGFEVSDWTRSCQEFSGGWQMRIALARLLLAQKCHLGKSLLILDEPTNHLDMKAKLWLAKYLKGVTAAVVLVSHDQKFLEEVCGHIVEVRGTKLYHYTGSYSKFLRTREAQQQQALQAYQAQQAEIARLQNFVDRFGAKATKASAANSKKKAIERIRGEMPDVAPMTAMGDAGGDKSHISVKLPKPPPCAREVLILKNAAVGYDNCEPLLENLNIKLESGMRLVILGPNGCGKSTLMRAMAGTGALKDGTRHVGMGVEIGVFTQDLAQDLPGEKSGLEFVLEVARERDVSITDGHARTALGALGLSGDAALRPIKALSGGEKARVALGVFMLRPYNCLLLDEASNHLDHLSALALARSLSGFQGALVAISHDQRFCEALNPTHIARVYPDGSLTVSNCIFGKVEASPNGVVSQSSPTKKEASNNIATKPETEMKNLKANRPELKPSQPNSYQDRKRLQQLQSLIEKKLKQLEDLEGQTAAFDQEMMAAGSDVKKAMEILTKKKAVEDQAKEVESQWEALEQELQEIAVRLST
ncbi:hypothetical protein R1flu_022012 [Riccia fluitans]|uniref:ABC transporter domain-containing protein n=1 Tax=Riccia fluitans TaxID=41844 RepID=A0ABD1ZU36_9MARC